MTQAHHVPYPERGRSNYQMPESRFVAPERPVARTRARTPIKGIIGWSLAVMLVAVTAGVVWVKYFRVTEDDAATKVPQNTASQKAKVLRGDEVVRQYLDALAKGDTDTALSLGQTDGAGSARLITKQAYAASLKSAPITAVNVPQAPENTTEIPATYKLGDETINATFRVAKQDNGSWLLARSTATFRPVGTGVDHVPLLINGVSTNWENPVELLPGRYQMSTGLTHIAYPGSDTLTVPHLNYPETSDHQITPTLTARGKQAFVEAAQRSLEVCLSRRELSPANCPMSMENVPDLVPGSPQWSIEQNPIPSANPALNASDQSKASVTVSLNLRLKTAYKGGGRSNQPVTVNTTVTGVMTPNSSSEIKLEWRIN